MANFNMQDYVSVAERVSQAQATLDHVQADPPVMLTETMGYIRVTVALKDNRSATGTASFRLDLTGGRAQATNPLEDAETSAIGRALAFLGFSSSKSIASRDEVEAASFRATEAPAPAPSKQPTNGHDKPTPAPANGKRPRTRAEILDAVIELQEQAVSRGKHVKHKPLDDASDNELIEIGKAYRAALEAKPASMETADLPL